MYQISTSNINPFWSRNNENKPSKKIFEQWKSTNLTINENITINFSNLEKVVIHTNFNGIKYIEIKNMDDENDTRYYYVDSITKVGSNNTYEYTCIIDIYTSYTINFIEKNKEIEFNFIRQHEYDKECLQINDELIESIPKFYNNYYPQRELFNYDETNNIWYSKNIGIKGKDLVNANKYFVFKDGVNGGYKYFPILSKNLNVDIYYQQQTQGKKIYESTFKNGRYNNFGSINNKNEISPELNAKIQEAYEKNNIIKYFHQNVNYGYKFPAHTVWLSGWNEISGFPYGTLPIDVVNNTDRWNNAGPGFQEGFFKTYLLGNEIYNRHHWNITASKQGELDNACNDFLTLKCEIYENIPKQSIFQCENSFTKLNEYRKKADNINKFLGIYYLPHFLNFKKFNIEKNTKLIYVNIEPTGDFIDLFPIYSYNLSNINDKYNNTTYSTPYLLKFLNIKYYGNQIFSEYRINNMNKIFIGGKMFFTDTCNIISKSDNLLSLADSIISFPYQLPIGVDTYEQYVKANRGVTDTSFNIAKQQQDLNLAKSIFSGAFGFATSGIKAGANLLSGDVGGAVKSAIGGVEGIANTGFAIAGQMQGMKNQQMQIKAQYEQAKMTKGNQIQFSNIQNASLTEYYDSNDQQFECVEVSDLNESSLAMINNIILLYGYFLPNKMKLKDKLNESRLFNFIQIDSLLISQTLNLIYDENAWNNQIYAYIIEQLSSGIRIWNQLETNIPEYDDNEPWPETPEIPDITPPKPPIDGELVNWDFDLISSEPNPIPINTKVTITIEISLFNDIPTTDLDLKYQWFVNDIDINNDNDLLSLNVNQDTTIKCVITDKYFNIKEKSINLIVKEKPTEPINSLTIESLGIPSQQNYFDRNGSLTSITIPIVLQSFLTESDINNIIALTQEKEPYVLSAKIIDNGVNKFTINITGEWNDNYNSFQALINDNNNAQNILEELVINISNQQVYDKLITLNKFNPDTYNRGGWFDKELKNIKVNKITINKV